MKWSALGLLLGLVLAIVPPAWAGGPVILLTDERPPFETENPDGSVSGLAADCVKCVLEKMGREYVIKCLPWQRAQSEVMAGNAHGFFAASRNEARDRYAALSVSVAEQYWNWYLRAGCALDPGTPDFKTTVLTGSWFGSNSLSWLKKSGYRVGSEARTIELLVRQLLSGRLDAIFGSNYAFRAAMAKMGLRENEIVEIKGLHRPMGVYFAKSFLAANPAFLEEFNRLTPACRK